MNMQILTIARDYLVWHYSVALVDITRIWWNYVWFVNHFFSVPDVIRSWIAPFKRLQEEKVSIMKSPEVFFANLFVNLMMRIVGTVIRTALLAMALLSFLFVIGAGVFIFCTWIVLPVLVGHFFITGFRIFLI